MKILLISMPRSGGKFFQINTNSYLTSRFNHPLTTLIHSQVGVGELLYVKNIEQQGFVEQQEEKLVLKSGPIQLWQEFYDRLKLVCSGPPVVAKYMPIQFLPEQEVEILNTMIPMFDRVYLGHRINYEEQKLSWCLAKELDSWFPGNQQRNIKHKTIQNPHKLNTNTPHEFDQMFNHYNCVVDEIQKIPLAETIKKFVFEELIRVSNCTEFCEFLDLPIKEFTFYRNMKEFGDKKTIYGF
jgi:hypothetical protein